MTKRLYKDEYLNLGFTYISQHGIIKLQCVICAKVLSNESFKHNKLKRHLEARHSRLVNKQRSFFEKEEQKLKRQRLDVPYQHSGYAPATSNTCFVPRSLENCKS